MFRSRILLVDDHELVRKGIASLLENDWDICGQAGDGLEAVEKVRDLNPDLVLLDLSMPLMSGTTAAREIHRIAPQTKIIFLSIHDSDSMEELSRLLRADAYLSKTASPEKLKRTISTVLAHADRTKS